MKYKQLTYEERVILITLKQQGLSIREIADRLGRHFSTLYRELKRNRCNGIDTAYRAFRANRRTVARRRRSRRNSHYTEADFKPIKLLLKKKLSPEQVIGYMRRHQLINSKMSHETIYQYVWRDKKNGGDLWTHLRQSSKQRRKRYNAYDSRGRLAQKRHISERPEHIETRAYKGHWEIDTVHGRGSNHCVVTLLERKTGYVLIGKSKDKSTRSVNKRVVSLINNSGMKFKTITADNGTEFHQYKQVEAACDLKFYFASPYHSWERGSNENVNGLIRQYLPKIESMANLTQQKCERIAKALNERPRKRYDYQTPKEVYFG
jgi:IS30 family transposase